MQLGGKELGPRTTARLAEALRKIETSELTGGDIPLSSDQTLADRVMITSETTDEGRYPGTLYTYDVEDSTWTAADGDIWVVGGTLKLGTLYRADLMGFANERHVYMPIDTGGAPEEVTFWHDQACVVVGNALTDTLDAAQRYNTFSVQSASALHDEFQHTFTIAAGDYTFHTLGQTTSASGIVTWEVDHVPAALQDWYSASTTRNVKKSDAVTLTDGRHMLTGRIGGKNPSSSGYDLKLTKSWLVKCPSPSEDCPEGSVDCAYCDDECASACYSVDLNFEYDTINGGTCYDYYNGTRILRSDVVPVMIPGGGTATACAFFSGYEEGVGEAYLFYDVDGDPEPGWRLFLGGGPTVRYACADFDCATGGVFTKTTEDTPAFPQGCWNFAPDTLTVTAVSCDTDPTVDPPPAGPGGDCNSCETIPEWTCISQIGAIAVDPETQGLFSVMASFRLGVIWDPLSTDTDRTDTDCIWRFGFGGLGTVSMYGEVRMLDGAVTFNVLARDGTDEYTLIASYTASAAGYDCTRCIDVNRTLPVGSGADSLGIATDYPASIRVCPGDCSGGDGVTIHKTVTSSGGVGIGGAATRGVGFTRSGGVSIGGQATVTVDTHKHYCIEFDDAFWGMDFPDGFWGIEEP